MNKKLCNITDRIPIKIFTRPQMGPVMNVLLTNTQIYTILNSVPCAKHIYAIDKETGREVLLTRKNYSKSTEELFGKQQIVEPDEVVNIESAEVIEQQIVEPDEVVINTDQQDETSNKGEATVEPVNEVTNTESQTDEVRPNPGPASVNYRDQHFKNKKNKR